MIVPVVTPGSHPAPVTVTTVPGAPALGVIVNVGAVTVNADVAVLFVGVAESETVIVYAPPAVAAGIVNVTPEMPPVPEVWAPAVRPVYSVMYVLLSASETLLEVAKP